MEKVLDGLIITAAEAHEQTVQAIKDDDSVLIPIMTKIKEAIKQKDYHCYIKGNTPDYVIQKLQTLGYKTEFIKGDFRDPRETDIYKIMWN